MLWLPYRFSTNKASIPVDHDKNFSKRALNGTLHNAAICSIRPNSGITWHCDRTHIHEPMTAVPPIITLYQVFPGIAKSR